MAGYGRKKLANGWEADETSRYYIQYYKSLPNSTRITLVEWREGWKDLSWTRGYQKCANCHGMMYWQAVNMEGYAPFPDEISTAEEAMAFLELVTRIGS